MGKIVGSAAVEQQQNGKIPRKSCLIVFFFCNFCLPFRRRVRLHNFFRFPFSVAVLVLSDSVGVGVWRGFHRKLPRFRVS